MFHAACVRAMERFNVEAAHLCPCCRLQYHAKPYDEQLADEGPGDEEDVAVARPPLWDPAEDALRAARWDALR